MEEITPITRTIKRVEDEKGVRFHCLAPHNPHYYMQNGVLRPIDVLAVAKNQLTTGKLTADIRGSHVVSVGLNKADTYEKFIGFRRDDKQDGSEQFEISYLGATYNGIAYSSDPFAKKTLSGFTNRVGNLHVFSNRHRTRLALPATKSVGKFRIQFKIHTVGLTAKQVGEDFHFVNARGQFRFGLKKPSILGSDYEPYKIVQDKNESFPFTDVVAHHLDDLGKGEYLYTKESTDLFKGLPSEYLIDAETVYSETSDGTIIAGSDTWSEVHARTSGAAYTSDNYFDGIRAENDVTCRIRRSFCMFDTSALSGGVTSALLSVVLDRVDLSLTVCAQEGTQGNSLEDGDFDAFTGNSVGSVGVSFSGVTRRSITFDATGRGFVNIGGTTYVCLREYSHDYLDVSPNSGTTYSAYIWFAEHTGTTNDPYLSLELSQFTPRIIMVC